jgi:hypothetical protein
MTDKVVYLQQLLNGEGIDFDKMMTATTYIPSSLRDIIMEKGILAGPPLLIWLTPPDVGEEE